MKELYPILEFDPERKAFIEPKKRTSLPSRLIICFLKKLREIISNPNVLKKITNYLEEQKIDFVVEKTWTTDAYFRETVEKIALRKEEDCVIVEMEQFAMIAVSEFRNIEYGAIIYGGDDLTNKGWDSRNWHNHTDIRYNLTYLYKQIVLRW